MVVRRYSIVANAFNGCTLSIAIEEGQLADSVRDRTTEQIAYVILLDTVDSGKWIDTDGEGVGDNANASPSRSA